MIERDAFPRLDALLDGALERPPAERARFIAEACGENRALRGQLEKLIALAEGGAEELPPSGALQGPIWEDLAREISTTEVDLQPGEHLGRYQVRGLLGVGGMGRVYRAFDPVLAREVAIKVLSETVPGDPAGAHRRLEREARLLANLNHPNIAAIYGFERLGDAPCLVLELVEGQTLAERLKRGALPLAQGVEVALQVAEALEAAHRSGVVHRDLKPANVKLTDEGRVKVLDFGIAKPVRRGPDQESDPGRTLTGTGVVLGTAPYMSPEQVRGEPVDTRTDVWAFGCLFYEILTAHPAFRGKSAAEVMASVLRDEVDWDRLPPSTPASLRRLLSRCLRRTPRDRLQDIGDARLELVDWMEHEAKERPVRIRTSRRLWPGLVAAGLAALAGFWIGRSSGPLPRAVARLSLELPAGMTIASDYAAPFAITPDGTRVAVLATEEGKARLYLRDVASLAAAPIPGTDDAWQPVFSPDGRQLAFFAERKLKRVSLDGGPAVNVADVAGNPRGASFSPDGSLILAPAQFTGLARVGAGGGALRPLTQLDLGRGESSHRWPQVLPGGRWVLFTVGIDDASYDDARLEVVSLDTGERRRVLEGGAYGRYGGGRIFFTRAGRLLAVPFDVRALAVQGTPETVIEGVRYDARNGATHFALSDGGTLVYGASPPTSPETHMAWVDGDGNLKRIGGPRHFREPSLSPDGRQVATRIGSEAESDLWIVETESGMLQRLSFGLSPHRPTWTPDGHGVTVAVEQDGRWKLLTLSATGPDPPTTLYESPNRLYPATWSRDGRRLVFQERRPTTGWDIRLLAVGADGRPSASPQDLAATPFQERNPVLSLDGKLIAYESDELDGVIDVYVAHVGDPTGKVRATGSYARWPRWGPRGQLYFWYPIGARPRARPLDSTVIEGPHRVDVLPETSTRGSARSVPLWGATPRIRELVKRIVVGALSNYDVDLTSPNPRFLILEASAESVEAPWPRPAVVLNWFDELDARATPHP